MNLKGTNGLQISAVNVEEEKGGGGNKRREITNRKIFFIHTLCGSQNPNTNHHHPTRFRKGKQKLFHE